MFIVQDDMKIRLVQGDTGTIRILLDNYTLKTGDEVHFAVVDKELSYDQKAITLLIEKCIKVFDNEGGCSIPITEEDTINLAAKTYAYDIRVLTAEGIRDTVVTAKNFIVMEGFANAIKK